ncbi:glycosyltransferase [Boudabousia marimammalium]|uniref:Glycosyl transferase family 1 domain-containing protein n=1 Tax=Boudabousia marimammalium TaxID=156892 RepID=A0A1Q5PRV4_9ACTO|nr:glycosyltransferase [Boudabousia marimammalium]OKL50229.1 hypothetical protein BM477_02210 [Boudabousia marimammalium]
MSKLLLMLTDSYPYDKGEEFFEQEIPYLNESFDKVVVVPVRYRVGAEQTRTLPSSTESYLIPKSRVSHPYLVVLKWLPLIALERKRMVRYNFRRPITTAIDLRFAANVKELYSKIQGILREIRFSDYDEVVIYSYWCHTGAALGVHIRDIFLADHPRVKVVSRAHAYDVDEDDTPYRYIPARKYLLTYLDRVFPISNYAAAFLHRAMPEARNKIIVARLGVPGSKPIVRHQTSPFHIVSCSHMAPYKRVGLLLDSIAELQKRGEQVYWTHIGEFNEERLEAMRAKAEQLLEPGSYALIGHQSNESIVNLYEESDFSLFVNVSSGEGVPVTIMEAQSAGLPVLATDAGGTKEIVIDGVNGRIIPVSSSKETIAEEIQRLMNLSRDTFEEYSIAARQGWATRSQQSVQYQKMADFLSKDIWNSDATADL